MIIGVKVVRKDVGVVLMLVRGVVGLWVANL